MNENNNWRFCIVGNIKKQHTKEDGQQLYGTIAFTGGTKVYINDRSWELNSDEITVIGLNRFKRYAFENVPVDLIENVRVQKIFKPTVLKIMDYLEIVEGIKWRERSSEEKRELSLLIEKRLSTVSTKKIELSTK